MFGLIVWVLGLALEGLLLVRALSGFFLRKYIIFYTYVGWVLGLSTARLVIYLAEPTYYPAFYWHTQPISVLLGCGVLWEIYRQALGSYPGAARMARDVLAFSLLIVSSKTLVKAWSDPGWRLAETTAELERNMRVVQAILLIALVVVIAQYAIPLGRNLKGMILGYGFFISTSVINLTCRLFLGDSFQKWWQYLQPIFYLAVLSVWCWTLWSYQVVSLPIAGAKIEEDYQLLAAKTRKGLLSIRAYLGRVMRP